MEHCRVNAFNLVPFQLISPALHVFYDRINSSLCRWTEDSLPFHCSKGSKAVGALAHGWEIRIEESSSFSDKQANFPLEPCICWEGTWKRNEVLQEKSAWPWPRVSQSAQSSSPKTTEREASSTSLHAAGFWRESLWVKGSHWTCHDRESTHCQALGIIRLLHNATKALQFPCSTRWGAGGERKRERDFWKNGPVEIGTDLRGGAEKMKGTCKH